MLQSFIFTFFVISLLLIFKYYHCTTFSPPQHILSKSTPSQKSLKFSANSFKTLSCVAIILLSLKTYLLYFIKKLNKIPWDVRKIDLFHLYLWLWEWFMKYEFIHKLIYPGENKLKFISLLVMFIMKCSLSNLHGIFQSHLTRWCHPKWREMMLGKLHLSSRSEHLK